ncbi:hypothetical protein WJX72_008266 [[Myrmecia] bisecta]|uniref:RNA helicase n=1 Tax=[Myrmecia] bisecta TaxID=41462 RepID=A0AAW1PKB2_9CHLO
MLQLQCLARRTAVNGSTKTTAQPTSTFESLGLSASLLHAVAEHRLTSPTEIQAAAIPVILKGGDVLLASHTGSGKTLAYLLPLIKLLKEQEAQEGFVSRPKRPRAIVLGPTRELTDQILRVAKSLSHHVKFRSTCVNGGGTMGQQTDALANPLDIVIGTPQKVAQHAEKGHLYYGDVQLLVLDEADTMFDRGFGPEVKQVLQPLRSKSQPAHCILVSATLSKAVRQLLDKEFPGIQVVETKSLHKGVAGARHSFLPLPPEVNKLDLLAQVVEGEQRRGKRLMVFCNTLDSCRATEHFLQERAVPTVCYHGDVPLNDRRLAIERFACSELTSPSDQPVLVCTDLAARGLDMPGRVDHVINFDFPLNPIDYIHRTGRTARAGAAGRITSIVSKRDQVLAGRIEQALQQDLPLDELSAARSVLPPNMRPKPETLKRRAAEKKAELSGRKGMRGAARIKLTDDLAKRKSGQSSQGKAAGGIARNPLGGSKSRGKSDFIGPSRGRKARQTQKFK